MYGDPQVHPQPETYWGNVNPIGPRGVYDEAKRYAEALTMAYHRQQGVDTAIVRIFNTYGPRMRPHDGRAIPTFIRQAMEQKPLTVFGDGSQTRSFCYVDDLVRGLIAARRERRAPAGQHRQPAGVHDARARREGDRGLGRSAARSSSRRCRPTIRRCASRTSRARASCSAGSPRWRSTRACAACALRSRRSTGHCLGAPSSWRPPSSRPPRSACPQRAPRAIIQHGIFDDAQIHYGNPDQVFPVLKTLKTQLIRINLVWGGPNGVAQRRPENPTNPNDPAYDWSTYDRTVNYAAQYGIKVVFSIIATPPWANGAAGVNVAPTNPLDLQRFATAAARATAATSRRPTAASSRRCASGWPGTSPTTPPSCGRSTARWPASGSSRAPIDYAKICNAIYRGVSVTTLGASKVACGVTGPRGNNNPNSARPATSPLAFLRAMKKAGATRFDAYAHHPYYGKPSETPSTPPPPGSGATRRRRSRSATSAS